MGTIVTMAAKDLRLLLRDKAGFFFVFCFPLIYAMEGGVWRGLSPTEMLVPCGILIAIGMACFSTGAFLIRRARV